ncbi:MAG: acetate--CoA ligase [Ignavibacteriaceae bacterium]
MNSVFDKYFYPESVCIAGASSKKGSLGYELTNCIKSYGYTGRLFLVNPKADQILGIKCFASVNEITEEIDLAIVMVPKQFAEDTIRQFLNKQVKAIILITAGFKETGKEGETAEKRISELVKENAARLVGPNCMGIINTLGKIKLNATFVAERPATGRMAFCSQSGAIGAAVLNTLRLTDIRFAHFISVGNKADVTENDLLDYWQDDENINVITFYLESFERGEEFIGKFRTGRITKPVIVLKAGRTRSGMKAASSHTGALGSSDKVVDAVLSQFGILRAIDLNDLFNIAKGFESFPIPQGNRIAVVTNAGGPAILTVDSLEPNGLKLADLTDNTRSALREIVHPEGSVNNPVDLLPGGDADTYKKVNELLLTDANVDAVISIFVEPIMVKAFNVIENINSIKSDKPLFQIVMPLPEFWDEYRKNSISNKQLFRNPEDVSVIISAMLKYNKRKDQARLKAEKVSPPVNLKNFKDKFLPADSVDKLAEQYKFPRVKTSLLSFEDLNSVDLTFPVVLKAVGEKIIHKSDLKGVILNIKSRNELLTEAEKMIKNFKDKNIEISSFMIQRFIRSKHELLIGAFRDSCFGPMVMFGSGGKYVEVLEDTVIKSAYLSDNDIEEMINESKIGRILRGVRGEEPADIDRIGSVIRNLAQMMLNHPEINEVDLNPVIISDENKIYAVDIRIKC